MEIMEIKGIVRDFVMAQDSSSITEELMGGHANASDIHIVCVNIASLPRWLQFTVLSMLVFVYYILYGYYQELIFRADGFKPFGWYLTLVQFGCYIVFASTEHRLSHTPPRTIPLSTYIFIALLTVATMGLSNSSIGYLNYPTQVIFKCCKLIPVLIGGIFIQGKKYGVLDMVACLCMSVGLIMFILADSVVSPSFNTYGIVLIHLTLCPMPMYAVIGKVHDSRRNIVAVAYQCTTTFTWLVHGWPRGREVPVVQSTKHLGIILISLALCADAVIGNVQERVMRQHQSNNVEMVLYSYTIGFAYILVGVVVKGEMVPAFTYCLQHPKTTYLYAVIMSMCGYMGLNVVLSVIKHFGALAAVTVTTCRKAITVILSFAFFTKPFTIRYVWAGCIVLLGIYLNLHSKNRVTWNKNIRAFCHRFTRHKSSHSEVSLV